MEEAQIYQQLTGIFRDIFDDETITLRPETTAKDIPLWDSFNHINLIVSVGAEFKITFQTAELENLRNVGELVHAIQAKVASR